jgi:isochorismate synthase
LAPDNYFTGLAQLDDYAHGFSGSSDLLPENNEELNSNNPTDYLSDCNSIIDKIKNNEAQKVVYSRMEVLNNANEKRPADLLLNLKNTYPDTFSYLFHTPQTGTWMGASPEVFLRESENMLQTIALAGTRAASTPAIPSPQWPEKEKAEQKFVSDYIQDKLEDIGIAELRISEPYTSNAGAIEHIRSDFFMDKKPNKCAVGKIIQSLHPTPAVCGQPLEAALKIISETEKHSRAYYTGFLGLLNMDGKSDLFVNLRCMKIVGKQIVLYIGGGITAESNAEAEWNETVLKAGILKKVIEQV